MISLGIILVLIVVLLLLEVPVAYAFASGALLLAVFTGRELSYLLPHAFWQIGGFAVLALPLFVMAGSLMEASGISERLIAFVNSLVGRIRGGLGAVTIVSCALFGAIAGSGSSAIAAVGSTMIPRMYEAGYPRGHSVALVACSSVLAQLIPPSIPMIVFALTANIPVAAAFLATVGAGVAIVVVYCVLNWLLLRHRSEIPLPSPARFGERMNEVGRTGRRAFLGLLMPVIMLGGIYGGIFTPTEAAAVAFVYILPVGFLFYRELNFANTYRAILEGVATTGAIIFILFALAIMSRAMILDQIPNAMAEFILSLSDDKLVVLALINVLLLLIGMLVDDVSGSILAAIILMPVVQEIGVHPLHFAAIVGTNLGLGNVTPPCAPLLYMAGGIGGLSLDQYAWPALKFMLIGHLPVVLLVTYFPDLSLFLPRVVMGIG